MSKHLYGSDQVLPVLKLLQAGPVSVGFENGALRYVRVNGREVLRSVYMTLRDHNWGTFSPIIENENWDIEKDQFKGRFTCRYERAGQTLFVWQVQISGSPSGQISFRIEGEAKADFLKNRAGFCILHPIEECAGQKVWITEPNGQETEQVFPKLIAPDRPFPYLRGMRWEVSPSIVAYLKMDGDDFETEDHRNWTDTSYKTFCTPLNIPFPVELKAGEKVAQSIQLSFSGLLSLGQSQKTEGQAIELAIADTLHPFPEIGTLLGPDRLNEVQLKLAKNLKWSHLRVELDFEQTTWPTLLEHAKVEALALSCPLWVSMNFGQNTAAELTEALGKLGNFSVSHFSIFEKNTYATPSALIADLAPKIRQAYPRAKIGAGVQTNYTELGRNIFEANDLDFVCFGIQPQEHAFDLRSLVENLESQADVVFSAQALYPAQSVVVSPLNLRRRFNPYAREHAERFVEVSLESQNDPRYASSFGAGWFLGSLAVLAQTGISTTTFFRHTGLSCWFEAEKTMPCAELLKTIQDFAPTHLRTVKTSDKLRCSALRLEKPGHSCLLLANHQAEELRFLVKEQQVVVPGFQWITLEVLGF
jgi:D-apionolactonase